MEVVALEQREPQVAAGLDLLGGLDALGEQLRRAATATPKPVPPAAGGTARPASAITLSLDSTFIRGCREGERHLEVRVGNAEAPESGGRQVFGAVANAGTDIVALLRRTLGTLGCTDDTALTAFTDARSYVRYPHWDRAGQRILFERAETTGNIWSVQLP